MNEVPQVPAGVDTGRPTPARIYDYMLQGNNYFQVDRFAAEQILKAAPEIKDAAWSNRGFHQRAAKWIAQHGVRQFVDIGSGLPTVGNTHEVVQKVVPTAHVVYIDNDPMVELHSRALLDSGGTFSVICADLREPDSILDHSAAAQAHRPQRAGGLAEDRRDDVRLRHLGPVGHGVALRSLDCPGKLPVAVAPHRRLQAADRGRGLPCRVRHRHRARRLPLALLRRRQEAVTAKPTVSGLGIDLAAQVWHQSGRGDGAIEVAFVRASGTGSAASADAPEWVLMRVAGDPEQRVLVFDRHEWECFLDGARNGEFDDAATSP